MTTRARVIHQRFDTFSKGQILFSRSRREFAQIELLKTIFHHLHMKEWQFRIVGFGAVAIGFVWLIVFETLRPVERSAVLRQYSKIEMIRVYTGDEVRQHVREVAFPEGRWFGVIPAVSLMFVGAMIAGVGKRFRS